MVPGGTRVVDDDDVAVFLVHFGTRIEDFPESSYALEADFDGNGIIDLSDFFILADNHGRSFVLY